MMNTVNNYAAFKTTVKALALTYFFDGSLYTNLNSQVDYALYKDAACTQEFNGTETVTPSTVAYCKTYPPFDQSGGEEEEDAGYITGSITLTNQPAGSLAYIGADYSSDNWDITLGTSYHLTSGGPFSIPLEEEFLVALQSAGSLKLLFRAHVSSGNPSSSGSWYDVDVAEREIHLSDLGGAAGNRTLDVGDLGTVNLAAVKLSGTLTVNNNGQPVPLVWITAYRDDTQFGSFAGRFEIMFPATTGAAWEIFIPAQSQAQKVGFGVEGYYDANADNMIGGKGFDLGITVSNQPVSGIPLNAGDISDSGGQ
jgi:hypothetical protein